MKLFQMKTSPLGVERITEYLEDNFLCIGYPGTGDLEHAAPEEIRSRLISSGWYQGQELETAFLELELFVHDMQDGDYILIADGEWAHLGDLGDYFYDNTYDKPDDGRCHRRGVTWLKSVPRSLLNAAAVQLLAEEGLISRYSGTLPSARLELWLETGGADISAEPTDKLPKVDAETIAEAIAVLQEALRSEDIERRERAAAAILFYAK